MKDHELSKDCWCQPEVVRVGPGERFQYEHIAALVVQESVATGRTVDEILDAVRNELATS